MPPLSLLIKPASGLCNMNCKYCFYKSASEGRKNRIMTEVTVSLLIKKISEFKPSSLSLIFQGGEPTLAGLQFYKDFVNKAKNEIHCPVSYAIQTNGLLIDDSFAEFFKENNFLVGISLDGNAAVNDRYRLDGEKNSTFSRVINAVSTLEKHGVEFNILSVIDNKNAKDIESIWNFFRKSDFNYLQFIPCTDENNGVLLSPEKYEAFLKTIFDLWYEELTAGRYVSVRHIDNYIGVLLGAPPENCAMCGFCGSYFVVEANGDLYPCDFYCKKEYSVGNINNKNPLIKTDKHRAFIEESKLIHERCRNCKYYLLCRGGCKKDRTDGYTENKYCKAYYNFFEYATERMINAAKLFN